MRKEDKMNGIKNRQRNAEKREENHNCIATIDMFPQNDTHSGKISFLGPTVSFTHDSDLPITLIMTTILPTEHTLC